jgi:hypothetical protein
VKLWLPRKIGQKILPLLFFVLLRSEILGPESGFRDPGSGIRAVKKSGSVIRDKHPGSATMLAVESFILIKGSPRQKVFFPD